MIRWVADPAWAQGHRWELRKDGVPIGRVCDRGGGDIVWAFFTEKPGPVEDVNADSMHAAAECLVLTCIAEGDIT